MIDDNKEFITQQFEINETCCSKSSCCGTKSPIKRSTRKIGRNERCPCGSERKFKKCCGLK